MNLNDMIAALWGQPAQAAPVPPPFMKDQSRVINTPYPPPFVDQSDVAPGLMMAGAAPIVPQGFQKR